ncbi:MAG TPA: Wzz/FepE/Etk N-terminal domain-containing protein [Rubrobacter sp.]|nr:Wzz/FepE/Etk N-terminal domain-containing protein [Rubrobacter sp.]
MNSIVKYTPPAEDGAFVSIADTARSARRRLWIVILLPILTVGTAVGVSLLQTPVYEASARVVVSPREGATQQDNLSNTISGLQALAIEMEAAGLNRSMVEDIVKTQGEPGAVSEADLNNNLTIAQLEDTRFLTLTYNDTNKIRAQEVVNNAAEIFAKKAPEASGVAADAAVKVSAYAGVPPAPEEPDPVRNGLGALVIGLMLGVGLAFLLEYLYLSGLRSPEKVEQVSGVPTFGTIPDFKAARARKGKSGHVA